MMMDRNREARRAAAMSNGIQRRRHRPNTGSLRDSPPDDDGPLDLRDRTVKRERDRDMRHRVDRDRERDRLNRSKRRRGGDDGGGGGGDDSSEESVNDEDDDDDAGPPPQPPPPPQPQSSMRYVPPVNPGPLSSSSPGSTAALSHRKSYPPPTKMFRSTVAPTWKAPDEIIGFSIPRKARSASTKRSHDCWTSSAIGGDHLLRQQSSSPVRSTTTATTTATANYSASPLAAPMSPSSSNISIKKKVKPNGGSKPKGVPKPSPKSSPLIQEEIEIEVAEVLYGLMRQSQPPSTSKPEAADNDPTKADRSNFDSKSSFSPPPFTTVAPKRKRPRTYPEENPKLEPDQVPKPEARSPNQDNAAATVGSTVENPVGAVANGVDSEGMKMVEESKVEEITSPSKLESQHQHRVESTSTSAKPNSTSGEKNTREEKFEIDLMAPPPPSRGSPERAGGEEYGGKKGEDKSLVTDMEAEAKLKEEENEKVRVKKSSSENVELNVNTGEADADADADDSKTKCKAVIPDGGPHKQQELHLQSQHHPQHPLVNLNTRDHHSLDLHLDLDKSPDNHKPPSKAAAVKEEPNADTKPAGQSSSMPMPMSVPAGWHGGLGPMGYGPMASPPIQPQFMFSQPKPKRCATHCCIARSISVHQQMMKMHHPFWPAPAGSAAPLFGGKPPYNINMVPSADLHAAARAGAVSSSQDKGQPFAFFPGQPASKDKSPLTPNPPDSAQKKQFLLPQNLPPGAPSNVLPVPAFFFPFGQQQAAAAASGRPSTTNPPSTGPSSASTPASSVAPAGASSTAPSVAGPAMTFSYPNMAGSETQFMAIVGNSPYPFPIPAHVGGSTSYRGSQPQAMSFFNGSFYSSQMLHPSQLQQQPMAAAQSLQIQQQNNQNPSISTSSSSSQKHLQNQQQRLQGNTAAGGPMASNSNLQSSQAPKNRPSQPNHEVGSEDSPSTADSRTRPNLSVYGQNFAIPFHSPNFALLTPSSSIGGGGSNAAAGVPNGNLSDKKKQQQQQSQQPAFPMSFASVKGPTAPGLDISSMANNPAILQSLPEAVRQNYQIMAAAAQAAQAANQRKNVADPSGGGEEERRVMASRTSAAPVGQSIAFSRDLGENSISTMPGNSVVDSSARSVNPVPGSNRPTRSSGPNALANSSVSNPQQQQQMLFPKQQQFVAATVAAARSKIPSTSNGGAYSDHLTSKFPNNMPNFPLAQSTGTPSQSSQWKNSVRPNTSQVSSPPVATSSTTPTIKNLPQQQGRPQQNHTQISFASSATNPKPSPTSQGQQVPNSNQLPFSSMMGGSPSNSSVSKSGGVSARTVTSSSTTNKAGPQTSTLSTQQGKNPSTSLSSQKPSILGSPHMMSNSNSSSKPQSQESQQQPQLSKQSIQQAQLFFSNAYMQASANTSAGGAYYLQRHRSENQQQQQTSKSQGPGPPTSSSGMLSLCTPVSMGNTSTSDPAKAVVAAAANSMKGSLPQQGMFHAAAQFVAAQSAAGAHQLVSAGFPYVHAASTAVQIKPAEQKQPADE